MGQHRSYSLNFVWMPIGVAEGGSGGSEEPPLGGSNRARKRRPVLLAAYV